MARRRRLKGSLGGFALLVIAVTVVAGALVAGKWAQDVFMSSVKETLGVRDDPKVAPPPPPPIRM